MSPIDENQGIADRTGEVSAAAVALPTRRGTSFVWQPIAGARGVGSLTGTALHLARLAIVHHRFVALRSFVVFLCIWWLASLWNGNALQLPSPLQVAAAFGELAANGAMLTDVIVSTIRVAESFVIAIILAVPLGFVMGLSRSAEGFIDPMVELLRPISGIAWIPMGMFIFGVGNTLPIFIMVYVAFFPLLLNTIAGVRDVDRRLTNAARTMGVGRPAMLLQVVVPAALPMVMVGFRLAFAGGWSAIIAAELIGSTRGLGYAVEWYHQLLMTPKVFAVIATIGIVGYLWDLGLRALQRWLTPWTEGAAIDAGGAGTLARPGFHWNTIPRAVALPVIFVVVWQLWTLTLPAVTRAPTPVHVVRAFIDLIANGGLAAATALSLMRVMLGFAIAMTLGGGIGVLMGANGRIRKSFDPIIECFRPIAPIALLPIAILWFGTGTSAAVFLVAYAAFFPALINTVHTVGLVDRKLVRAAQTMGVPRLRIITRVILPASVPNVLLGARISMGVAWTAIVAAELAVGAKSGGGASGGIGQMMFNFYAYSIDQNGIVVCMIVVGIVALLLDRLFRTAERQLMPWRL